LYFSDTAESANAKLLANGPSKKIHLVLRKQLRVLTHAQIDVGLVVVELECELVQFIADLDPPAALIFSITS
jgi:hypothetical protein